MTSNVADCESQKRRPDPNDSMTDRLRSASWSQCCSDPFCNDDSLLEFGFQTRIQLQARLKIFFCLRVTTFHDQGKTAIEVTLRQSRIELECLSEVSNSFIEIAVAHPRVASFLVCLRYFRIQFDGPIEIFNRGVVRTLFNMNEPAVVVGFGKLGIELYGAIQVTKSSVEITHLLKQIPTIVVRVIKTLIQRQSPVRIG